jgi:hypothetical protein
VGFENGPLVGVGSFTLKQTGCDHLDISQNGYLLGQIPLGSQAGAVGNVNTSDTQTGFSEAQSDDERYGCSATASTGGFVCGNTHDSIVDLFETDQNGNLVIAQSASFSRIVFFIPEKETYSKKCVFQKSN